MHTPITTTNPPRNSSSQTRIMNSPPIILRIPHRPQHIPTRHPIRKPPPLRHNPRTHSQSRIRRQPIKTNPNINNLLPPHPLQRKRHSRPPHPLNIRIPHLHTIIRIPLTITFKHPPASRPLQNHPADQPAPEPPDPDHSPPPDPPPPPTTTHHHPAPQTPPHQPAHPAAHDPAPPNQIPPA